MRSHVFGLVLFILTFFLGSAFAPGSRFFEETGIAGGIACGAKTFASGHGEEVVLWSCSVFGSNTARGDFAFRSGFYRAISTTDSRMVGSYFTGDHIGYCILRVDGDSRTDICSLSLNAALEFEEERFRQNRER